MTAPNAKLHERLLLLKHRLSGKTAKWPPDFNKCPTCGEDITFHLAGLFLKDHIDELIDATKAS